MKKSHINSAGYGIAIVAAGLALAACTPSNVSFSRDVQPILKAHCVECHHPGGPGYAASGFDVSTYQTLMKGGKYGVFIKPGDAVGSTLIALVEGRADPSIRMPHNRDKLSKDQIELLKTWVKEGAKDN